MRQTCLFSQYLLILFKFYVILFGSPCSFPPTPGTIFWPFFPGNTLLCQVRRDTKEDFRNQHDSLRVVQALSGEPVKAFRPLSSLGEATSFVSPAIN